MSASAAEEASTKPNRHEEAAIGQPGSGNRDGKTPIEGTRWRAVPPHAVTRVASEETLRQGTITNVIYNINNDEAPSRKATWKKLYIGWKGRTP